MIDKDISPVISTRNDHHIITKHKQINLRYLDEACNCDVNVIGAECGIELRRACPRGTTRPECTPCVVDALKDEKVTEGAVLISLKGYVTFFL